MIDKKYIDEFKKTKIYSLIKKSVEQQQIGKMLQGQGKYSMSFLPISTSTDTSLIITGLHILLSENIILNSDINNAFNTIVISIEKPFYLCNTRCPIFFYILKCFYFFNYVYLILSIFLPFILTVLLFLYIV